MNGQLGAGFSLTFRLTLKGPPGLYVVLDGFVYCQPQSLENWPVILGTTACQAEKKQKQLQQRHTAGTSWHKKAPFACLVGPYRSVREMWKRSEVCGAAQAI